MKKINIIKKYLYLLCIIGFLFNFLTVAYALQDPVQFIKGVTNKVFIAVSTLQKQNRLNEVELKRTVNHLIIPNVDFG